MSNCGCNNPCQPTPSCECKVRLNSDCITVSGAVFTCSSIDDNLLLTDVLSQLDTFICTKFDQLATYFTLVNVGGGNEVYKGVNGVGAKEIRTLTETGSLIVITQNENTINFTIDENELNNFIQSNQITYSISNVGGGSEIYKDTTVIGNNIQFNLGTLKSNNILIEENVDGSLQLTAPEQGDFIKSFYVNSNYIPSIDSPADGSIIRPFPTYDEAKTAFIGTGSVHNPEFINAKIILQTDSSTANNPSINYLMLEFQNNSTLSYTGDDDYMFDTEVILASSGELPEDLNISIELTGIGSITRTGLTSTKVGLVRGMGTNRGVTVDLSNENTSRITIAPKDNDNITLIERAGADYAPSVWDGDITYPNGIDGYTGETLESFYGYPHKYSLTLVPTQPLVYIDHRSFRPFGYSVTMGGTVRISTLANTAIYAGSNALLITGKNIILSINGQYISTTSATKLISNPYVYAPHPDRNLIDTYVPLYMNGGIVKYDGIGEYTHNSFNSFIKIKSNEFNVDAGSINAVGSAYVENFIDYESGLTATSVSLKSNLEKSSISISQGQTFLNTEVPNFTIIAPNVDIRSFQKITPNTTVGTLNTLGTVSTYNEKPIQTLPQYSSKAAAKAAGLTPGSEFVKVTNVNADDLQSGVEYKITTEGVPSLGTLGDYFTATGTETGTGVGTLYEIEILI